MSVKDVRSDKVTESRWVLDDQGDLQYKEIRRLSSNVQHQNRDIMSQRRSSSKDNHTASVTEQITIKESPTEAEKNVMMDPNWISNRYDSYSSITRDNSSRYRKTRKKNKKNLITEDPLKLKLHYKITGNVKAPIKLNNKKITDNSKKRIDMSSWNYQKEISERFKHSQDPLKSVLSPIKKNKRKKETKRYKAVVKVDPTSVSSFKISDQEKNKVYKKSEDILTKQIPNNTEPRHSHSSIAKQPAKYKEKRKDKTFTGDDVPTENPISHITTIDRSVIQEQPSNTTLLYGANDSILTLDSTEPNSILRNLEKEVPPSTDPVDVIYKPTHRFGRKLCKKKLFVKSSSKQPSQQESQSISAQSRLAVIDNNIDNSANLAVTSNLSDFRHEEIIVGLKNVSKTNTETSKTSTKSKTIKKKKKTQKHVKFGETPKYIPSGIGRRVVYKCKTVSNRKKHKRKRKRKRKECISKEIGYEEIVLFNVPITSSTIKQPQVKQANKIKKDKDELAVRVKFPGIISPYPSFTATAEKVTSSTRSVLTPQGQRLPSILKSSTYSTYNTTIASSTTSSASSRQTGS